MIIDAHNHPDWHGHNLIKFIENMDRYNIDKTLIMTWECPEDEYDPLTKKYFPVTSLNKGPIPFERCLSYMERAPKRFVLGYAPDPRKPDAMEILEAAVEIYGVKVYGELKLRMLYDNLDALRMFRFCSQKGLPVVVHIDYEFDAGVKYPRPNYWYGGGIESFERALEACPETTFLGHAPGFWSHISRDDQCEKNAYPEGKVLPGGKLISMLEKYPNLYCDISAYSGYNALKRDLEFTKEFLLKYQDRVLYGRDRFENFHQEFLNELGLPTSVLEKIYCENARRLIKDT